MTACRNDGKDLERKVRAALKQMQEENRALFHRFPDTLSAGGHALGPQPGDFMLLTPKMTLLIEAKSTDCGSGIMKLVKGSQKSRKQIPQHRKWHRAGHPSVYWWGDITQKLFKIYRGGDVVELVLSKGRRGVEPYPLVEGGFGEEYDGLLQLLDRLEECK